MKYILAFIAVCIGQLFMKWLMPESDVPRDYVVHGAFLGLLAIWVIDRS